MPKLGFDLTDRELLPGYLHIDRNPHHVRIGTTAISALFHPRLAFGSGVQDDIWEHRSDDGLFLMVGSHQHLADPLHAAALPRKAPNIFAELEGDARIGGKAPLFEISPVRWFIEPFGAFPIKRYKDLKKEAEKQGRVPTEEEERLLDIHHQEVVDLSVAILKDGHDVFTYPSGTRDKNLAKIRDGVGKIATGVSTDVNLAILPISYHYPSLRVVGLENPFRPTLYIGQVMHGPFKDETHVGRRVLDSLRAGVVQARQHTPKSILHRSSG